MYVDQTASVIFVM